MGESSLIYSEPLKEHYVVLGKKFWSEEKDFFMP